MMLLLTSSSVLGQPISTADDLDLAGCSVSLDQYIFNLNGLAHTNKYHSSFIPFHLGARVTIRCITTTARAT